jgi:hypothetical protein
MRVVRLILAFVLATSCSIVIAQDDGTQGEHRFKAAQDLMGQDMKALLSLKQSGKYSQASLDKLTIRLLMEDNRLIVTAGLIMNMEIRAMGDGKNAANMYTDFFPLKEVLALDDHLVPATMHDRSNDGLPKSLIH